MVNMCSYTDECVSRVHAIRDAIQRFEIFSREMVSLGKDKKKMTENKDLYFLLVGF